MEHPAEIVKDKIECLLPEECKKIARQILEMFSVQEISVANAKITLEIVKELMEATTPVKY